MSKASFNEMGVSMDTAGKFLKAINDFPVDFLTAVPESIPLRVALYDAAYHWGEHLVKEALKNYPLKCNVTSYNHRSEIPYSYTESPKLRVVTPEMLKTRNILESAVEVFVYQNGTGTNDKPNLPSHYAIVLIDRMGNFSWDFFQLNIGPKSTEAVWLAGDRDSEELDFPTKL